MTIRKRLTLWYAILLTCIIIAFGTITFVVMRIQMIANIDSTLEETASLVTTNSRLVPAPTFGSSTRIEIRLASLDVFRASGVYVQAWEIVDDVPVFKDSSANVSSLTQPLDADALGASRDVYSNVAFDDIKLRVLTKPIVLEDRLVGNVQVAGDLAVVNQTTDLLLVVMLVSCGVAIVGAVMLSTWFSYRALKPIEEITLAASSIAGTDDLQTRLNWHGPADELGRLTSVFNQMMGRIEHMFSVQQRFIADISHELRTPLTTIKGNIDIAKRYGMDDAALQDIEIETQRMSRLINDLLMLARADYGGIDIDMRPLDLDVLVKETFRDCQEKAQDRDLELLLDRCESVRVNGDADRLRQLVTSLMDNAIKFTEDGGEIFLGLKKIDREAILWVQDTGVGMSEDVQQRVFDRFFQLDPSRAKQEGDFGLGLSISRWIAETHGGSISVNSQPETGTTFTVRLPIYDPNAPEHASIAPPAANAQPTRPRLPRIRRNHLEHVQDSTNGKNGKKEKSPVNIRHEAD